MLINYLPAALAEIEEMREICKVEQPLFNDAAQEIENILCRAIISLADEKGIERFEKVYGIISGENQTLEERRINILIRRSKKILNLADVTNLIHNYSNEIKLVPDYNSEVLTVFVGDKVDNIPVVYKTLDDLISMQILIRFAYETANKLEIVNTVGKIVLETTIALLEEWSQSINLILEFISEMEISNDVLLIKEKDAWYLDGAVKLDGNRTLSAIRYEEVLE